MAARVGRSGDVVLCRSGRHANAQGGIVQASGGWPRWRPQPALSKASPRMHYINGGFLMAQQLASIEVIPTGDHANTSAIGQYDFQARMEAAQSLLTSDVQILSRPHRKELDQLVRDCRRAIQALEQGFEPTTPPEKWVAGFIRRPGWRHRIALAKRYGREVGRFPYKQEPERWPREATGTRYARTCRVFTAPVPASMLPRINEGLQFFGNDELRIYSPRESDFQIVPLPLPVDPVVIGRLSVGDRSVFFEVVRWDVDKELAALYEAVSANV